LRAVCFLAVLVLAKLLMLAGQPWTLTAWAPVAWFSHDVLVAAIVWLVDFALGRPRLGWIAYTLGVLYVALNVPIATAVGSPLTMAMIDAARGPLADSVTHHATWSNVGSAAAVALAGIVLPLIWIRVDRHDGRRIHWPFRLATAVAACGAAVLLGGPAVSRVDTHGLHRNAFTALLPIGLPVVAASPAPADWRESPIPAAPQTQVDLTRLGGAAGGMNVLIVVLESTGARYLAPYGARFPASELQRASPRERSGDSGVPTSANERRGADGAPRASELGGVQGTPPFKQDRVGGSAGAKPPD
jgi:hypothetical protein